MLRDVLQRGLDKGWPITAWLQTWIVLQGIRGKEGIQEAERAMGRDLPNWSNGRYAKGIAEKLLLRWVTAVARTQRIGVFSHEEGFHSGMGGHNYVNTLRCPRQRCNISHLAVNLEYLARDTFAVPDVLAVKQLVHKSGIMLRLATQTKEGAGLATQTSYNAMHWARSFSMLMRDVRGGHTLRFTEQLWAQMLRCQGGAQSKETLVFSK